MKKTTATTLKNQLGKFMRAVQSGKEVLITDRDRPVAKLVPVDPPRPSSLTIQHSDPAAPKFGQVVFQPLRVVGVDTLALLMSDRAMR